MDSLTQALLGAATFAVVKDKEIGKKSLLIGAVAGTLPDLDVLLFSFFHEVAFLSVHRSISHSVLLAIILSVVLGEIFHRFYKKKHQRSSWYWAFFLSIFTHSILDWFTTYGTKLISPFDDHLFSLNSIHVFEPIYSGILIVGLIIYLTRNKKTQHVKAALLASSIYLLVGIGFKNHAYYHFQGQLQQLGVEYKDILVSPTPFNTMLWHGIVKTENGYYFGTYSIFDGKDQIPFQFEQSDHVLSSEIENNRLIKYFLEYTQGFPLIKKHEDGTIEIYAIKYGPVNYFGKPEFINPIRFNEKDLADEMITIDYSKSHLGPVKNYKNLCRRILGKR